MQVKNFDKFNSEPYSEIGQKNPIRWMNVKPIDGGWEAVSHWWKCKDFMNDALTSWWLKKDYAIYGFRCEYKSFFSPEQQEFYFLLKGLLPSFTKNLEVVNKALQEQGMPPVRVEKLDNFILLSVPRPYLENTLFMSTVLLWVRLANTEKVYDSLDKMAEDSQNTQDDDNYKASKQKPLKQFPHKYKDFIFNYGGNYTCHKDGSSKFTTSTMHNCGVLNWAEY